MPRKIGIKNKIHIEYICLNCLKCFGSKKSNYEIHINKKFPCKPNINLHQNNEDNILNNNNNIDNNNEKHSLKISKLLNNNILSNNFNNQTINDLLNKIEIVMKENVELKEEIKKFKNQITNSKVKNIKNIKNINNVNNVVNINNEININIQFNNFNNV